MGLVVGLAPRRLGSRELQRLSPRIAHRETPARRGSSPERGAGTVPAVGVTFVCCAVRLSLVGESPLGVKTASTRGLTVGRGIPVRLWRCAICGHRTYEGWVPPSWGNAVARRASEIRDELQLSCDGRRR